ncbi:DNA primase [Bacillus toyonensis]|uniref:phage/plasmid primase, P4 family n=4 Tax=Bacillus toyonensis TaxID=155322 RepID=UPI000BF614E2|nr:phage/plasmid primase, P4 family [Bacillus toyonensis]PFY40876.1 DNA primase [Bacillus toyonensis]PHG15108.1 DNA primase [Bacillus toyonensis]
MQNYENIPDELRELKQWCCFKLQQRGEKMTKIPIDANTGGLGKSNDESTWATFEVAMAAIDTFHCDGIGFYFKPPYFGIDMDNVREEIVRYQAGDHEDNMVSEFIEMMCSYTEYSVSGNGIHIIAKGDLPKGGRRKGNVEMYDSGRFFAMTGNIVGHYTRVVEDEYGQVGYLHNKYIAKSEVADASTSLDTPQGVDIPEAEIIQIACNSKNGMRFTLFMNGGWEPFYDSQSEADMAFANDLAFWTNRDVHKMDRIFRSSSLYREKWDRTQNQSTYGAETLQKAILDCTNAFIPRERDEEFNLYVLENDVKTIEKKLYSYDDTGNAKRFTDAYGEVIRYSYIRKNWYFYDGKIWLIDQQGMIKTIADKVIEKMKEEPVYVPEGEDEMEMKKALHKHLKSSRGSQKKTNMIKESEHLLPIQPHEFDNETDVFNVQNGYLDLRTGKLHEHDKTKFFTKVSSVEYTDKMDCPLWMEFLHQIFDGDQALIEYMQRAVGYSLSGSTEEQMMFILHGNGRNGKSVFLDVITEIFGSYATNIQPQTIMVKQQSSGANSDIARLDGARLVTTTEPNEGVRLDEGLVKQLTGGDKVTARFLYENEFDFMPQFKLWMATNHKPIIRGTDDGIWRRLAIVPFTVQIPKEKVDKQLKHKLRRELKAILNWAVEGYIKWRKDSLQEPQIIQEQREEYRTEMDSIEAFIEECCKRNPQGKVQAKTLYHIYRDWASENGQYMMSNTKFGREMGKKFHKYKSNGVNHYNGIELLEEYEKPFLKLGY